MAKDPICGMNVNEKTAKIKSEYMGKTYYFCNQACKTTFDKNPMRYAGEQEKHSGHSCDCGCR
ncbi:YHS domain-containing protein [Candidatus Bathyarchaeota archaeon]|nr:YHS domain-containing protein [Candidatus Bathyarchaeota archaeon]